MKGIICEKRKRKGILQKHDIIKSDIKLRSFL